MTQFSLRWSSSAEAVMCRSHATGQASGFTTVKLSNHLLKPFLALYLVFHLEKTAYAVLMIHLLGINQLIRGKARDTQRGGISEREASVPHIMVSHIIQYAKYHTSS